jgi:hypothetical protein
MPLAISPLHEFGTFRLDPSQRLLSMQWDSDLRYSKAFDLLVVLVEQNGRLMERYSLMGNGSHLDT